MPEVNLSMAFKNLAMEIKPFDLTSDLPQAAPAVTTPGDGQRESFRSVLDRAEKDSHSQLESDRTTSEPEKPVSPVRVSKKPVTDDTGDSQTDMEQPAGGAVSQSQTEPQSDTAATGSNVESEGSTSEVAVKDLVESVSVPVNLPRVSDQLLDLLLASTAGRQDAATVVGGQNPGEMVRIQDVSQVITSIPINTVSEIGTQIKPETPVSQFPVTQEVIRESAPVATVDLSELVSETPRTSRGSEWTEVLEFNRLLNPTWQREQMARTERIVDNMPDASLPRDKVQIDAKPQIEMQRNPGMPGFDTMARSGKTLDPNLRIPGAGTENQPQLQFSSDLYRASFATVIQKAEIPVQVASSNVQGGAAELTATSQQARPIAQPVAPVKIDTEVLMNDVREVLMRVASDGRTQVRMVLHPPELGELVVRLESARNGVVRAEFHTISPLVRESLEAGLSKLTQALEAEGLTLAQADVHLNLQLGANDGSNQDGPGFGDGSQGENPSLEASDAATVLDSMPVVDRLPEGATISVLA